MNPDIKQQWIAALRSGKYKQTQGALRKNNKFCCLGVLCDLSGLYEWRQHNKEGQIISFSYDGVIGVLPHAIADWADLEQRDPQTEGGVLSGLNDQGYTFKKIASIIEEEL